MTTTSAKSTPRHRAAPRLVPTPVMILVLWLGTMSAWAPRPLSALLGALAVTGGVAYFIQRWRRAGWDLAQNVARELDR